MEEDKSPLERLRLALANHDEQKKQAAESLLKSEPQLDELTELYSKLEKLPQPERRAVLDGAGLRRISAAPRPITPIRGGRSMLPPRTTAPGQMRDDSRVAQYPHRSAEEEHVYSLRLAAVADEMQEEANECAESVGARTRPMQPDGSTTKQVGPFHCATQAVDAGRSNVAEAWQVFKPKRYQGYTHPLYRFLTSEHERGKPEPTARDVLEAWRGNAPPEIAQVLADGFDYYDSKGNTKAASLTSLRKAIGRMTDPRQMSA